MRLSIIAPAAFLALAACELPPPPANQARGYPVLDRSTRTLYINNVPYQLPEHMTTARLINATDVTVDWEQQGDTRVVTLYRVETTEDSPGHR